MSEPPVNPFVEEDDDEEFVLPSLGSDYNPRLEADYKPISITSTVEELPTIEDPQTNDSYQEQWGFTEETDEPEVMESPYEEDESHWDFPDTPAEEEADADDWSTEAAVGDGGSPYLEESTATPANGLVDWETVDATPVEADEDDQWDFQPEAETYAPALTDDDDWGFDDELTPTAPEDTSDDWGFEAEDEEPAAEEPDLLQSYLEQISQDVEPVEDEDWGFEDTATPAEDDEWDFEPQAEPADGTSDDEWGFSPTEGEEPENSWDEPEFSDSAGWDAVPAEDEPAWSEESSEEDFVPPENPFALPPEMDEQEEAPAEPEDKPAGGGLKDRIREKIALTLAQVKSELKGEDGPDSVPTPQPTPAEEPEEAPGEKTPGLVGKIFKPYLALGAMLTGFLLKVLGVLTKIPAVGPLLGKIIKPGKLFNIIGLLLPLLIIVAFLQWHSSRPLDPPKKLTFPDEGSAVIKTMDYSDGKASVKITNTGAVIAEVIPTVTVHSTKLGLNPLGFFYAKPNRPCVGEPVSVGIEETVTVEFACSIEGKPKKFSGSLEWAG